MIVFLSDLCLANPFQKYRNERGFRLKDSAFSNLKITHQRYQKSIRIKIKRLHRAKL